MAEITINGNVYRTGKIAAMEQFHVVRRLLPIVTALGSIPAPTNEVNGAAQTAFLETMVSAISKLSDEDCEYVIGKCLAVCQRQQGQAWANVWNARVNRAQFDDIDLQTMMNLTTTTLSDNLANFFPALPFGLTPATPQPNAQ